MLFTPSAFSRRSSAVVSSMVTASSTSSLFDNVGDHVSHSFCLLSQVICSCFFHGHRFFNLISF